MSVAEGSRTRRRIALGVVSAALLIGLVLMMLIERAFGISLTDVKLGILIMLLPLSLLWTASLDEVARQAHYWAWFWGCAGGLSVMAVLAVFVHSGFWHESVDAFLAQWQGAATVQSAFLLGLLTTPLLCLAGFAGLWAHYWLRRH